MKLQFFFISLCSVLTLSACNMQQNPMPVEKPVTSVAVDTSVKVDLSKYQNQRELCTKVTKKLC